MRVDNAEWGRHNGKCDYLESRGCSRVDPGCRKDIPRTQKCVIHVPETSGKQNSSRGSPSSPSNGNNSSKTRKQSSARRGFARGNGRGESRATRTDCCDAVEGRTDRCRREDTPGEATTGPRWRTVGRHRFSYHSTVKFFMVVEKPTGVTENIKDAIFDAKGVPQIQQEIYFDGERLAGGRTVQSYMMVQVNKTKLEGD